MIDILVVDDDPNFADTVIKPLLPFSEYRIFTAANIEEARYQLHDRDFRYVIIDIRLENNMEDDSGMVVAAYIRAFKLASHIIMATNHATLSRRAQAIRYLEVDAFIEKDKLNSELLPLLKRLGSQGNSRQDQKTLLTLTLSLGQPITFQSIGRITASGRTSTNLQVRISDFVKWGEIARKSKAEDQPFIIDKIGRDLEHILFSSPEINAILRRAQGAGKDEVVVTLNIPIDMSGIPFEFLPDITLDHPFTRFISGEAYIPRNYPISSQTMTQIMTGKDTKLRILLVASDTYRPIPGVDREIEELATFFEEKKAKEGFPISVDIFHTEQATDSAIQNRLSSNEYDIIHYAGHSLYKTAMPNESSLFFYKEQNRKGEVATLTAATLNQRLKSSSARLIFLNSCWSSAADSPDNTVSTNFFGLAEAVVSAGIPTCIGYRWPIDDSHARAFAKHFYSHLLKTGDPTLAVWNARRELNAEVPNKPVWRSLVLVNQG